MSKEPNTPALPEPLTPPDCDLTDFDYMPLDVARLRRSKQWLVSKRKPEIGFYALNLWLASWHELPAASLENDDDVLADAAMCAPSKWKAVKAEVMRGWSLRSDGRLYHPVVAEKALIAWIEKLGQRKSSEAGNAKRYKRVFDPSALDAAIHAAVPLLAALAPHHRVLAKYRTLIAAASDSESDPDDTSREPERESRSAPVGSATGSQVEVEVKGRDIRQKDKPSVFPPGWSPDETDIAVGFGLGLERWEVEAAGRQHVAHWSTRPDERRTAAGWRIAFHEHLRTCASDQRARRKLKTFRVDTVATPAPVEGPAWWRALADRLQADDPGRWVSYWRQCTPLEDGRTLACSGGPTALEWLQGDGVRQARRLGLDVRIVAQSPGPGAQAIPAGIEIAGAA